MYLGNVSAPLYSLEKVQSIVLLVDFPHTAESSNFHASHDHHGDKAGDHNGGLEHVGPEHSLEPSLATKGTRRADK